MKKYLASLMVLLIGVVTFTSCNDDNSTSYRRVTYSNGAYIVNAGSGSTIAGSISFVNYTDNSVISDYFTQANGKSVGFMPNDGIVYGNKIYIVVDKENLIWVLDKKSFKEITHISTTKLMGDNEGTEPRHIIAGGGHVFFTTYGKDEGYVGEIDTTNYNLVQSYKVGKKPECLIGYQNMIYVANSDWGYGDASISAINLADNTISTNAIEGVANPQKIFIANNNLYVDNTSYDANWNVNGEIRLVDLSSKTSTKVADGKCAAINSNGYFYMVNNTDNSYSVYNTNTKISSSITFTGETPTYPCCINIDPITGHIFILSNVKNNDTGYIDYNANCLLYEYDSNNNYLRKYEVGLNPTTVFFDAGYSIVEN